MGMRFFRRVKIAPGLSVNLSKSGGSLSVGGRGAHYTVGSSGARTSIGLPGTGLYYTEHHGSGGGTRHKSSTGERIHADRTTTADALTLGFFQGIFTPTEEKDFIQGVKAMVSKDYAGALKAFDTPDAVADALFMAGALSINYRQFNKALEFFDRADAVIRRSGEELGTYFQKYKLTMEIRIPITEHIRAVLQPSDVGMKLARTEALQSLGNWQLALKILEELHEGMPIFAPVILSMCEILINEQNDKDAWERVANLGTGISNESEIDAAILYWKGIALHRMGILFAARDALTAAFRRKKGRDEELLRAIQYERALVYEAEGKHTRARAEFERIYGQDPRFMDVAERLNI